MTLVKFDGYFDAMNPILRQVWLVLKNKILTYKFGRIYQIGTKPKSEHKSSESSANFHRNNETKRKRNRDRDQSRWSRSRRRRPVGSGNNKKSSRFKNLVKIEEYSKSSKFKSCSELGSPRSDRISSSPKSPGSIPSSVETIKLPKTIKLGKGRPTYDNNNHFSEKTFECYHSDHWTAVSYDWITQIGQ